MLIQIIAAIALICIAALLFFGTSRSPQQSTNCTYCKYFDVKTQKCTNKNSYFMDVKEKSLTARAKNGGIFMMDEPQISILNFLKTSLMEVNES